MKNTCFALCLLLSVLLEAQQPATYSSTDIYHDLQRFNTFATALYIAAHPDDENTRLISYLSHHLKARTAYLSLTRGDGGQNLIGPELREKLGVIRTQELLAARRIDGGEQYFTRANDFGFSKHPEETLSKWKKDSLLHDMVWVIRSLKPDVIINRFDHRTPGSTHGHHTTSALLSVEAFKLAGDPNAYPGMLDSLETWQPKRLFFNTSWWFYGSEERFAAADKSRLISFDVGTFYPALGKSNNEIASLASSQHLSQGFGRMSSRGSEIEYLELIEGNVPENGTLFDGIDTGWTRIPGGATIGQKVNNIISGFNFTNPSAHLKSLVNIYAELQSWPDGHWKKVKSEELKSIISAVAGLYLSANSKAAIATPGETVQIQIEAIARNSQDIKLASVEISEESNQTAVNQLLEMNKPWQKNISFSLPSSMEHSGPFWLSGETEKPMYKVPVRYTGAAESEDPLHVTFQIIIHGITIPVKVPVVYRYALPDKGEIAVPFEIIPGITVSFDQDILLFPDAKTRKIGVTISNLNGAQYGTLSLKAGEGWEIHPASVPVSLPQKGNTQTVYFDVIPPAVQSESILTPVLTSGVHTFTKTHTTIDYPHIPKQEILTEARARLIRTSLTKNGNLIGYIPGAGDDIPASLERIGYQVRILNAVNLQKDDLSSFDAIVLGIRAVNTNEDLVQNSAALLQYVKEGGTLIVQYNTAGRRSGLNLDGMAPYPLEIGSGRVTDETAPVKLLQPQHPLLNIPNKITAEDFNGWVQERGLYFPSEWDPAYTPLLSMNDPGESPKEGSLLVAPFGKGYYIYTGLSFFRELPAGVPGAYRLFANMLALKQRAGTSSTQIKGK